MSLRIIVVSVICASLLSSANDGDDIQILYQFKGQNEGDSFGREVTGVGDVDGDRIPDIATAAPGNHSDAGEVFLYSGADGHLLYHFDGTSNGIVFGRTVAGIGDIDADGHADFIIGSPEANVSSDSEILPNAGYVTVYSGKSAKILFKYYGKDGGEYLGTSVSFAGDLDHDGIPDFLFTVPWGNDSKGQVFVCSGANGDTILEINGDAPGTRYGWAGVGGEDIDADKVSDILVGAPWANVKNKVNAGSCFIYSGKSGELISRLHGEAIADAYGRSVAMIGDINGDGGSEFAVGAPLANPNQTQDAGSVYVYSGREKTLLYRLDGSVKNGSFGFCIASTGDVDGDSLPDIIVGSQFAGSAYVYSGITGEPVFRFEGKIASDQLGFGVGRVGDISGDGLADVIVGAPGWERAGSAFVLGLTSHKRLK